MTSPAVSEAEVAAAFSAAEYRPYAAPAPETVMCPVMSPDASAEVAPLKLAYYG